MGIVDQAYEAKSQKKLSSNCGYASTNNEESYLAKYQLETLLQSLHATRRNLLETMISFRNLDTFLYSEPDEDRVSEKGEQKSSYGILDDLNNVDKEIKNIVLELNAIKENIFLKLGFIEVVKS